MRFKRFTRIRINDDRGATHRSAIQLQPNGMAIGAESAELVCERKGGIWTLGYELGFVQGNTDVPVVITTTNSGGGVSRRKNEGSVFGRYRIRERTYREEDVDGFVVRNEDNGERTCSDDDEEEGGRGGGRYKGGKRISKHVQGRRAYVLALDGVFSTRTRIEWETWLRTSSIDDKLKWDSEEVGHNLNEGPGGALPRFTEREEWVCEASGLNGDDKGVEDIQEAQSQQQLRHEERRIS
ncbi:hypothetical protein Hypma_002069 [Hypsizygus marmoreus]|uniref:Uncharacterized protein n=1 Tax=Hypsizygus marmoreus TaxID=39966 RepID=A0A369K2T5_HYPMA|nr:hypothetical protein Hypma_002069 [Hypsizygus marmoreus]